jgi:hypothetical protein
MFRYYLGVDLYEDMSAEKVAETADDIETLLGKDGNTDWENDPSLYGGREELEALAHMFRRNAERGNAMYAWY